MKKIKLMKPLKLGFYAFFFIVINFQILIGQSVNQDLAKSTAINFFTSKSDISTSRPEIEKIENVKINNKEVLSIVNFKNGGWVMISRDEKFEPILGYNTEGTFYPSDLKEHDHRGIFLNLYVNEINNVSIKKGMRNKKWDYFKKSHLLQTREYDTPVEPLLAESSSWSGWTPYRVSWPEDYVNMCAPLAIAQIAKFWEYPYQPHGVISYDGYTMDYDSKCPYNFDIMPFTMVETDCDHVFNNLYDENDEEAIQVSSLIYRSGYITKMGWSNGGTGSPAYMPPWGVRLEDNYGYSSSYEVISTNESSSQANHDLFKTKLISSLDNGNPIVFSYFGNGYSHGHSFILDGYQDDGTGQSNYNFFHCVLGRNGCDDGWFYLFAEDNDDDPNDPDDEYHDIILYHYHFDAMVNLEPAYDECFMKNDYVIHNAEDITWSVDKCSVNSLVIEAGGKLTVTSNVDMLCDSKIVVKRGGKLVVDGGTFTSKTQWEGIIVEGNSGLPQPNYNTTPNYNEAGIVVTQNNATIENAQIGISTNYSGSWSNQYWGGVVHCEDTDFTGCWKGVEFMSYGFENQGYFNNCTFSGWKEGVTIWDCDGIEFENCTFDNQNKGISFIDADILIHNNNTFSNCDYGVFSLATSQNSSRVNINGNQFLNNNDYAIAMAGQSGEYSVIEGNYFEGNDVSIFLDADNNYKVKDNNFGLNNYNVISHGTGYHYNLTSCNSMLSQYTGIYYLYDNQQATFLSNDIIGTYSGGSDISGWSADIIDTVGNYQIPAFNLFSGVQEDIDWEANNGNEPFVYYLPATPVPRTDPQNPGNYDDNWNSDNDFGINCETVPPPVITTGVLYTTIEDFCYWLKKYKENPNSYYYKWKFLQFDRKLHLYYYYWYINNGQGRSWETIKHMLERMLCWDRWKIKLYGHYLRKGFYKQAESIYNEITDIRNYGKAVIPEDISDESRASFEAVQRINLNYQQAQGNYTLSDSEIGVLQTEAVKNIPESAYAKGLLYLATGEYIKRELPDRTGSFKQIANNSQKQMKDWTIYPNPVNDELYVEYFNKAHIQGKVLIYDLLGKKQYERNIDLKNSSIIKIDVSLLNEGAYILMIIDANGKSVKSEKVFIGLNN